MCEIIMKIIIMKWNNDIIMKMKIILINENNINNNV